METSALLASIVRTERARLIATLVRQYGFDLAEETVDAAISAAFEQWPTSGVPTSPRAWLLSVARRRAIDHVRHRVSADEAHGSLAVTTKAVHDATDDDAFPDDRLRLVFTVCHPAIAREAQVALALRWLCGLSTEAVARAFCVPVATMAQRLTRAKTKIETARIPYEVPERRELGERVATVLEVVYAIFNEGYVGTTGATLAPAALADEAVYLGELLIALLPESADAKALLALLSLIHARRAARVDRAGNLVALDEQDRSCWDAVAIARGKALLTEALGLGAPSSYAIEAAIQALHDEAPSFVDTDFPQIAALYALLRARNDSPVVRVNEAVARAMVEGPAAALADLTAYAASVEGQRSRVPGLSAAKADLLRRLGRTNEACAAYDEAIAETQNEAEQRFLRARRDRLLASS